jgi:hypothetical protein
MAFPPFFRISFVPAAKKRQVIQTMEVLAVDSPFFARRGTLRAVLDSRPGRLAPGGGSYGRARATSTLRSPGSPLRGVDAPSARSAGGLCRSDPGEWLEPTAEARLEQAPQDLGSPRSTACCRPVADACRVTSHGIDHQTSCDNRSSVSQIGQIDRCGTSRATFDRPSLPSSGDQGSVYF